MTGIIDSLLKDDIAKSVHNFLRASRLTRNHRHQEAPINISILIFLAILMAYAKSLYGSGGISLVQHLGITAATFVIFYLVGVLFVTFFLKSYTVINNWAVAIVSCLLLTSLICVIWLIIQGGPTLVPVDTINDWLGLDIEKNSYSTIEIVSFLEDAAPALIYALVGCLAIFLLNWEWNAHRSWRRWRDEFSYVSKTFAICWFVTAVVTYYFIMDRTEFFNRVIMATAKIKFF